MYRRIVKLNNKKILLCSIKNKVITCFEYAVAYFPMTGIKENKNTYTVNFNNGIYDYTFILPKDYITEFNK